MATLDEAIFTRSQAVAGLTALVGARVYLEQAPQGAALPYIARQAIDGVLVVPLSGVPSIIRRRVQFSCWAATALEAQQVVDAVRDAFAGFAGAVTIAGSGSPPETFTISGAFPDTESILFDDDEATAPRAFGRSIDIIFHHPI